MAEDTEATSDGGGKKKIILMAMLALLLIGISVGGTIFALKILSPKSGEQVVDVPEMAEEIKKPAIYYPIKPEIVVNYGSKGRQRYAQVEVTLLLRDEDVVSAIELHAPMITNALVLTIGGQVYEEVQTAEGRELLRQQCLQELQEIMEKEIGKPGIEQVLFTTFIMQ